MSGAVSIGATFKTVAAMVLPAGNYLVYATGAATLQDVLVGGTLTHAAGSCRIDTSSGPTVLATTPVESPQTGSVSVDTFHQAVTLVGAWTLNAGFTARLECTVGSGTLSVANGTLFAIQVASVTTPGSGGGE